MSKAITSGRLLELLKEWGIPYEEVKVGGVNWRSHNRNSKGPWGENMYGSMIHHTGDNSQSPNVLWNGYAGLPGPLCHGGIDDLGIVHLVGWGRANHAGMGSGAVLQVVKNESWDGETLKPGPANTDGNSHFYGWEVMYDGRQAMTEKQHRTTIRLQAAILTEHNWTEKSCIAHGEWQQGKWDPGYNGKLMNMGQVRRDIEQAIAEGPKPKLPPRPKPPTITTITVADGDSFHSLARKHLGDPEKWPRIVEMNPGAFLRPGMKLQIKK